MLGQDVVSHLISRGYEVIPTDVDELDLTNLESIAALRYGQFGQLDWLVNCAAYTAVDKAEIEEALAADINGLSVGYLGRACVDAKINLIHISTDFVFDGQATEPYPEDALPRPLGAYGRTKLMGEQALEGNPMALIVRTAWLYGPLGKSFPRTMIEASKAGKSLKVVADQLGNPTYTADLARVIGDLIEKKAYPGIYHAVGPETMTWHRFAELAIEAATGEKPSIAAINTEDWPTPARRPKYSALGMARLESSGIAPMRPVKEALAEFVSRL